MTPRTLRRALGRPLALPLAILGFALALNGCSPSTGRVVARVDGQVISEADFLHAAQSVPAYQLDPSPKGKQALLDELVNRSLAVSEARRRGLDKTPEMAQAMTRARTDVLPQVLYGRVIGGRVRVTEDEARAMWEHQNQEWRIAQIFTFNESQALAAKRKLEHGAAFAQVAQSLSDDRGSGAMGGDLGYLTAGQMPREMENAIGRLKKGQWAGPIKTPIGFYLVQVTDVRPRQRDSFESTRDGLMNLLRQRKERALVLEYVARLKERRHLKSNPEGYAVLAQKWQNRSTADLLQSQGSADALGFTPAEQAMPLEKWDGGGFTIKDFFDVMMQQAGPDRPSLTDDLALKIYVQDQAVNRMILDEARSMGLEADPETHQQLKDREDSYLITRIYETVIVPSSQPSVEELEQLRASLGNLSGNPQAAGLLAQAQQQLFMAKRQKALDEFLARLRREHPPVVDERALAAVPWPVTPKENS